MRRPATVRSHPALRSHGGRGRGPRVPSPAAGGDTVPGARRRSCVRKLRPPPGSPETSGIAAASGADRRSWVLHRIGESSIVNLMVQYTPSVDRAFAALADPTRRAVLERLGAGSGSISALATPFGMSLTGMKKHVRLLEGAQLVTTE